jgi:hypothetical protein
LSAPGLEIAHAQPNSAIDRSKETPRCLCSSAHAVSFVVLVVLVVVVDGLTSVHSFANTLTQHLSSVICICPFSLARPHRALSPNSNHLRHSFRVWPDFNQLFDLQRPPERPTQRCRLVGHGYGHGYG